MKTYKPFLIESTNLPLIVYAFEDSNTNRTRNSLIEDLNFILPKSMIPESSQFAIIFPWNKFDGVQLADIHIYHDFNNAWIKANPSIRDYCWQGNTNYDWRNGSLLNEGGNSCETATIIRGIEGIYRRTTSSLDDYLSARPKLYHFLTNNQEF
ncbi:MAG: hypothetical protein KC550_00230 [Nanoarchaeota archaeon]|nr:hypothetical protein [Nanoarchaeota archaeon]